MSNLFKQYNTVIPQGARVMDYNSMVEQKLANLAKQQSVGKNKEASGFRGLGDVAEEVEVIEEDPQEILRQAKEEADRLLAGAKEKSEVMVAGAKKQSEELLREAKEDGHKKGYEEGFLQAKEELEAEYNQKENELNRQKEKLQKEYDQKLQELEPELLDVIVTVVEKVFHIQFQDKKEILLYLINQALANIESCKSFRIRTGEAQKDFLESHKEEILDRIGHDMSLEIISDMSLQGNQCIIETDTGIFDCSMDVQLKNLIKDLKSLSS